MAIDRRAFLARSLGFATVSALVPRFGVAGARFFEESIEAGTGRVLVILELAGGNDGLNTVVPYTDSLYATLRPTIGVPAAAVGPTDLDGKLALNPVMTGMKTLWDAGRLAVVEGVSYPSPNLSHFTSRDIWATADPRLAQRRGWLGRWADQALAGTNNPLCGCAISQSLPKTLLSDSVVIPSFTSLGSYAYQTDGAYPADSANQVATFVSENSLEHELATRGDQIGGVGRNAASSADTLKKVAASYVPKAPYPNTSLGNTMKLVAQIVTGGVGTRLLYVTYGGFDNHSNQKTSHDNLLKSVSDSVKAFFDDLDGQGASHNVMLMTWSEFGRRPQENGSLGTDHGTAGAQFLVGSAARKGVYGIAPQLASLDRNGNLPWQIDFRSYYGTILADWLKADAAAILGAGYPNLGCIDKTYV
jgi:uncharacterized protein (DUF1501 family)